LNLLIILSLTLFLNHLDILFRAKTSTNSATLTIIGIKIIVILALA